MAGESGEYMIVSYVDDLEMAMMFAKNNNLGEKIVSDIDSIRGDLVEISPLMENEEDYTKLGDTIGELLAGILDACRDGKEGDVLGKLSELHPKVYKLKTVFGLDKAMELLNGSEYTVMCTADENGKANAAIVGSASILTEDQLLVAHLAFSRTDDNLHKNKKATFFGYKIVDENNPMYTVMARVYCTLDRQEGAGDFFDFVKQGIAQEMGDVPASMLRQVYIFRIDEIRISSPSPGA